LGGDTRQPFAVRIPTLLFEAYGLTARALVLLGVRWRELFLFAHVC
jgi:hypothetical protein